MESAIENPKVDLDPDQINQVITNLFSNACDAMPEGGSSHYQHRRKRERDVWFSIKDTGIGISKENQRKDF